MDNSFDTTLSSLSFESIDHIQQAQEASKAAEPATAPSTKAEKLAASNAQIVELVNEINQLIDARLHLSELQHEIARLSEVKFSYERSVATFTKAACLRRDSFVAMMQKARADPDSFATRVRKEARHHGSTPVAPPPIVAHLPVTKPLGMRIKLGNAWHRKYEVYHARSHWSLTKSQGHVNRLVEVRDELLKQENVINRRIRIAEEGVVLITETIAELKVNLTNPPHHIYTDSWNAYVQLWQETCNMSLPKSASDERSRITYPGTIPLSPLPIARDRHPISVPFGMYNSTRASLFASERNARCYGSLGSYHAPVEADAGNSTLSWIDPADIHRELGTFAAPYNEEASRNSSYEQSRRCQITTESLNALDVGIGGLFAKPSNFDTDSPLSVLTQVTENSLDSLYDSDTPGTSPEVFVKAAPTRAEQGKSVVFVDQLAVNSPALFNY